MTTRIALLGCGEAGSAIGADLVAAGAEIVMYDPAVPALTGATSAADEREAVRGADIVLSVNSASVARDVLETAGGCAGSAIWADLNTGSPGLKADLARRSVELDVAFVDVAIMSPVPGKGLTVPMLVSGPDAERFAAKLNLFGANVSEQEGEAGAAAERKLLRSVFFKGLATSVVEALEAAETANCRDWLRANIAGELAAFDEQIVDRLVEGTQLHAKRRADEMDAATQMLTELDVEPLMARASRDVMRRILTR
ncbi:DUF1932 domain-containing protein [Aeromicrobium sp. CTD01-1L150]|uniref:NAD(P)-dependent oxidoreductase n=1 Tax=Aeromicrobium sp. CTD01-1L150 TaxID=3341830 RepID=UPI0035C1A560